MRIRLISGKYGGRIISAPNNRRTHPMGERIRGAMFNSISPIIADADVLDAFAGSGAIGLEAASRGARSVTLLEKDRTAQKMIAKNIESLRCGDEVRLARAPVASWSGNNPDKMFDIIFADPPYYDMQFSTVERLFKHLKVGGTMLLSHSGKGEALSEVKGIVVVDNRSYGNASLTYFRRES